LKHEHQGVDLRPDYAKETLRALVRIWKRPVSVATMAEGKPSMLRYDGREHTSRSGKAAG
jgi:stage V sporulation protein R